MEGAARQRLVDEHLSLVRAIATQVKKQVSDAIELDDVIAYGTEGLIEAADRFDDRLGWAFSTFAYHRVRGAIYDGLRRMGHLKRAEYAKVRMAERAHEVLENLAERERGARGAGAPPPAVEDDVRALHEALASVVTTYVTSLEALAEEGSEFADEAIGADELAAMRQLGGRVRQALAGLPEKERHFIEKHYFEGKTLKDAGKELGLSKSWASRLHARAIEMLREKLGAADS